MTEPVLVVGVGSELRTDDAVGRRVAEEVGRRGAAGVEVRSVHQLTPELAADLDGRRLVVFVDAAVDAAEVLVRDLDVAGAGREPLTHHLDPPALLALAAHLGWPPEAAAVVSIPVTDLTFGTDLTPRTQQFAQAAVGVVLELVSASQRGGDDAGRGDCCGVVACQQSDREGTDG